MASTPKTTYKTVALPSKKGEIPWVYFSSLCEYFRFRELYGKKADEMLIAFEKLKINFEYHMVVWYTAVKQKTGKYCTRFNHTSGNKVCTLDNDCTYVHACFICASEKHSANSFYSVEDSTGDSISSHNVFECPQRQRLEEEFYRLTDFYKIEEDELFDLWTNKPSNRPITSTVQKKAKAASSVPVIVLPKTKPSPLPIIEKQKEHNAEDVQVTTTVAVASSSKAPVVKHHRKRTKPVIEKVDSTHQSCVDVVQFEPVVVAASSVKEEEEEEEEEEDPVPQIIETPKEFLNTASELQKEATAPLSTPPLPTQFQQPTPEFYFAFESQGLNVAFDNGKIIFGKLGQQARVELPGGFALSNLPAATDYRVLRQMSVVVYY